MTLRLRLTLFYTALVACILALGGLSLHLMLRRSLGGDLDRSLQEAAGLLSALIQNENGAPMLHDQGEQIPQLPGDLVALLRTPEGAVVDALGRPPVGTPPRTEGIATWGGWRVLSTPAGGETLTVLRSTAPMRRSLAQFDRGFLALVPLLLAAAFALGFLFTGRALAPVDRLTRGALDLARRRAWRESLPEPATRDELWRLSRATNELLRALSEVIESERRFTGNAAHELRTPLTVVRGRLEQALEQARDPGARRAVGKARDAAEDLLAVVEGLLLLSRTEAGQDLAPVPLDLGAEVLAVLDALRPRFEAAGLALRPSVPDVPATVRADPTALAILLRNLLENALKFTPAGEVVVRVGRDAASVRVSVEDSGPGIPEEALPHLFERFYQANPDHRRHGHGLGLALADGIARWHGGQLTAENRPEGGARFTLTLPTSGAA